MKTLEQLSQEIKERTSSEIPEKFLELTLLLLFREIYDNEKLKNNGFQVATLLSKYIEWNETADKEALKRTN